MVNVALLAVESKPKSSPDFAAKAELYRGQSPMTSWYRTELRDPRAACHGQAPMVSQAVLDTATRCLLRLAGNRRIIRAPQFPARLSAARERERYKLAMLFNSE